MITIDELIKWPTNIKCFKLGSCHLRSTESDEELHEFALKLGMKREWFQTNPRFPGNRYHNHYDLTPVRREKAIQMGAVFVPGREQARQNRQARMKDS